MKSLVLFLLLLSTSITNAQGSIDQTKWRVINHQTIYYWYLQGLGWFSCDVPENVSVTTELAIRVTNITSTCTGADYGPQNFAWSSGAINARSLSLTTFSATAVMKFPVNTHTTFWFTRADLCQYPTDSYNYREVCNMTGSLSNPNYYELDAVEYSPPALNTPNLGFAMHTHSAGVDQNATIESTPTFTYHSYTFSRNGTVISISVDGATPTTLTDPNPSIPIYPIFEMDVDGDGQIPSGSEVFNVASFYVCSDPTMNPCTKTSPTLIFDGGFNKAATLNGNVSVQGKTTLQ